MHWHLVSSDSEQNYYLLVDKELKPTSGATRLSATPVGRYGEPADLIGTLLWLISMLPALSTVKPQWMVHSKPTVGEVGCS